jgi:microsomal dipeptidase-like Zn-dependent dipeptidase
MSGRLVFTLSAAVALLAPSLARADALPSRFALAGGCYRLVGKSGAPVRGAEQVRMQATRLGSYLLYRPDKKFFASTSDGLRPVGSPGPRADWRVSLPSPDGTFTLTTASGSAPDAMAAVRFIPASGCAVFPELATDATGTPAKGDTPWGAVTGLIDGHMHWMTFEDFGGNFHCGRPWSPYGVEDALGNCNRVEGPFGVRALLQNFLNYHNPLFLHGTDGYPSFNRWANTNLTYEGTYWRWVERAWRSGLRLMVMTITENRELCKLQTKLRPNPGFNCDEMDTVKRSIADMRDLQNYVDAQYGGPGKGYFQIVTDPYEARRVINRGKLAVVLEIELSEPFGCRGKTGCDEHDVENGLQTLDTLGVRSALLVNKFNNALSGVRPDSGLNFGVVAIGNKSSSGDGWRMGPCTGAADVRFSLGTKSLAWFGASTLFKLAKLGTLPDPPTTNVCNTRGLMDIGRYAVNRLVDRHMIVNADHMSQQAVEQTLSILETRGYSGVISPHGWMDAGNWPRIWKLGGVAFPAHADAAAFVQEWRDMRPLRTPYLLGWGFGADLGGLSKQPAGPGAPGKGDPPFYPFTSLDGSVTFQAERRGNATFDYPRMGVANYGMYGDWIADVERTFERTGGPAPGGASLEQDLLNGAEAYLEMWERADGVPRPRCTPHDAVFGTRELGDIHLDATWEQLLHAAGQPQQRGRAWTWCVAGGGDDAAVLDHRGDVELIASTAPGRSAGGMAIGARPGGADGVRVLTAGGSRWIAEVRGGVVVAVGVARRELLDDAAALSEAMTLVHGTPPAPVSGPLRANPDHEAGERLIAKETYENSAGASAAAPPGLSGNAAALLCSLR